MKLNLPVSLLTALLGSFVSQAIEVSDDYEQIDLRSTGYLDTYTSNTTGDKYVFILRTDLDFSPTANTTWTSSTPLVEGGNLIFTTADGYDPQAMSFSNGVNSAFYQPSTLTFDTLSNLTITDHSGAAAVNLGASGKLYIRNVNDGVEETTDVGISNNSGNRMGGAICASGSNSVIDISDNGNVSISGNSASSYTSQSYGGGIYSKGSLSINNNDIVNISGNSASSYTSQSYGGGIYSNGSLNICNNGDVSISGNSSLCYATDDDIQSAAFGGGIYSKGSLNICNNEDVSISGNSASYSSASSAFGGGIYSNGSLSINNNDVVSISGNSASSHATYSFTSHSDGGGIYSNGSLNICNNGDVSISNNSTSADTASWGGGIYSRESMSINNNGNVSISNNSTSGGDPCGGGIFSEEDLNINNNGDVSISGNFAVEGGGIYSRKNLNIVGNNSVTFEKNYEKGNYHYEKNYRLRSIYIYTAYNDRNNVVVFAAKTGGHITFYDSVCMEDASGMFGPKDSEAYVSLNSDYEDADGVTQKAGGDIIFSGKYTEDHLKEVKGGVAGTATEIDNSRTSELLNPVYLYGGTLRVEDKAVLKTRALNVTEGSNATLRISNAQVNAVSYNVTVNGTGTLELTGTEGSSKLTAKNLYIEKDGTLCVVDVVVPSEVITLAEAETVSIFNEKLGGIASANVYMEAGSTYRADGAHLSVQNGTLIFNATADEKINLVLTLMAAYEADSQVILFTDVNTVDFVLDNITATKSGQAVTLNAADYFTGDWINENTSLVYDKGTIYVTGVNRVIPEPATATLSLLALAGLAARRRRK